MKKTIVQKIYLGLTGLLLTLIGGITLIDPIGVKADIGIDLVGKVNLLNDIRATSALILALAILIFSGTFSKRLTDTSNLIASVLFLALAAGRILGIAVDGIPAQAIIHATALEFVLGTTGTILALRSQSIS